MIKQVIVIRKDLNMRKGKMIAQGAHAAMKVFFDRMTVSMKHPESPLPFDMQIALTKEMREWAEGIFTKICVSVNSEEELMNIYDKARQMKIPCALVQDCGLTEFNGVKTNTCVAVGPDKEELIDEITGKLPLL